MNTIAPIRASLESDRGQVRSHNEDFYTYYEPDSPDAESTNGWVYIVADGVGGADAGEVASQFASEKTLEHYLKETADPWEDRLVRSMRAANSELRQLVAERGEGKRMATTMVAAVIHDAVATIANVGDSRGYLLRAGQIEQVTKDQSLVAKLLEEGAITEAEAANHPHRNVILYSIGSEKTPKIDVFERDLQFGDTLLLCSDGLTRHVSDAEIVEIVGQYPIDEAAKNLVELANLRGGQDNITAVLIAYGREEQSGQETVVAQPAPTVVTNTRPPEASAAKPSRRFLVPYTIFLSAVEAVMIVLVWLLLRV